VAVITDVNVDVCPRSRNKLQHLLLHDRPELLIEMSVIIKLGKPIVAATYQLESDGPIILSAYRIVMRTKREIETQSTTNFSGGDPISKSRTALLRSDKSGRSASVC